MKHSLTLVLVLAVCAALPSGFVQAAQPELKSPETNQLNRFSFDARFAFNITARFKNLGRLTPVPNTRTTPNGDPYNYDDGYVLRDVSGNFGGQTWYWGYDRPGQVSGNTVLMSRNRPDGASAAPAKLDEDDPNLGAEFAWNRELGRRGNVRFGVELAANYLNVCVDDRSSFAAGAFRVTDAYPFTPGTRPPFTPPAYQGSYDGPGFVLGDTPVSSISRYAASGATVTGRREIDADIWGFRLGPYADVPLGTNWTLSLSAGLAVGLINAEASWNEKVLINDRLVATSRGHGSDLGVQWGGYAGAKVAWRFSERWSLEGGAQFQSLGVYSHSLGGRRVELDLSQSVFVVAGLNWRF